MNPKVAGVISLGSAGLRHAQLLINRGFHVIALRTGLGPTVHSTPGSIVEVTTFEDLLSHRPSFCVIASPTNLHLDHVFRLIEKRVPVLVEKPLIGPSGAIERLDATAKTFDTPIVVAFHLRFHPGLALLQEHLAAGTIGRALVARVAWGEYLPDWHPGEDFRRGYAARPDQDGGPISTLSHTLDYCIRLFGPVADSRAHSTNLRLLNIDVPEVSNVHLHHSSGATSSISLDFVTQPPLHRIDVSGSAGFVSLDFQSSTMAFSPRMGEPNTVLNLGEPTSVRMNCFARQLDDFILNLSTSAGGLSPHDLHVANVVSALHHDQVHLNPQR